jgi:hypothetical protein
MKKDSEPILEIKETGQKLNQDDTHALARAQEILHPEATQPGETMPTDAGEKGVVKGFRLKPSEEALIADLTQYAHVGGFIKEPTFQAYMMFSLNCSYARLQQDFKGGKKN